MKRKPTGRLELNWMGKDSALIPSEEGKYDYAWVDPDDVRVREVKPLEVLETVGDMDADGAEDNLVVIGDSGDALRSLSTIPEWKAKYEGQVKLVYIDPPFNTAQTFEHYADQLEHSVWLTMMRDRIRDMKPLLSKGASVWVHLDQVENHRMRVLLDEEFGPENFVAEVIWHKTTSSKNDNSGISIDHDTILVYRTDSEVKWNGLERSAASDAAYGNPDGDPRGPWREDNYKMKNGSIYPIIHPKTGDQVMPPPGQQWRFSQATHERHVAEGRIWWGATQNYRFPKFKRFRSDVSDTRVPTSIWGKDEVDTNRRAKQHLSALFDTSREFDTPKPERLLQRIIHIATAPGEVVLDFFGGSGTTAAVAHKMGRRWITVELQDYTAREFTIPRLQKVVHGEDSGGISTKTERVAVDTLPEGMTAGDAQKFHSLLTKAARDIKGLDPATLKALRAATKTKDVKTVQWEGGGGFTVAKVGPSMYDVDDDMGLVYLSEVATNGTWSKAVAGQMGFTLTPEHKVFVGKARRQRLAVIDGIVDTHVVQAVVENLGPQETAIIVGKGVLPGAADLLSTLSPGSRIRQAPDDLFPKGTVK